MSASQISPSIAQTAEQRAHEPSMEEILASIRRIIADDQMLPLSRAATPAPRANTPAAAPLPRMREAAVEEVVQDVDHAPSMVEVAELEEPAVHVADPAPMFSATAELRRTFPSVETASVARVAEPAPAPPVAQPVQPTIVSAKAEAATAETAESLVSASVGASVSSAFNALATTMFLQNTSMVEEALRDLLRPMLKQWLDDNLPTMVERLVRSEIERVARGGR
jgi:cell pole-organizing protein PopZ